MVGNILTILLAIFLLVQPSYGQIKVSNGELQGVEKDYDDQMITIYKGIPYAENPVRYAKPVASGAWDGVYNATRFGPSCMQYIPESLRGIMQVSEDCLRLNVYVPKKFDDTPLAVMIWIHGGGFQTGQGHLYNPTNMVAKGNVIVVTLNYRLSSFGFLYTGDENSPGNYGMWDQLLAIRWVQDNAAAFGGDPKKLTVFGESAGGWSTSLLLMSPHSQDLFQRAISQSGVFADFLMPSNPIDHAWALARSVNCLGDGGTAEMINCLRTVQAETLLDATLAYSVDDFAWNPCVDGDFLVEKPSLATDRLGEYDYMIGFNEMEGWVMGIPFNRTHNTGASQDEFNAIVSGIVYDYVARIVGDDQCALDMIYDSVQFTYTYWEDVKNDQERLLKMVKMSGDFTFVVPSYEMAIRHRDLSKDKRSTYLYYFTYKSDGNVPLPSSFYSPSWNDKATHADELSFEFFPELIRTYNQQDHNISNAMIDYWTNFAKTGNPNSAHTFGLSTWEEFGNEGEYVELSNGPAPTKTGDSTDLDPEHIFFWLKHLPRLKRNTCFIKQTPSPCIQVTEDLATEGGCRHLNYFYYTIVGLFVIFFSIAN